MSANVALSETFDQWRVKTNEIMVMTQTDGSSNFLKLTNTTNSTSNTTGSIISAGGAGFAKSLVVGENVNVHGNLHANGNITTDGDLTLGSADSDTITINGDIGSSLEPNANVTYHFGNSTMYWANGYFEAMNITQAADSGYVALVIDADDQDKQVVTIDAEQTTVNVFQIDADALTDGTLMYLKSDVNDASTRNLLEVVNEHTSATGTTALKVRNDAGRGLFIDSDLNAGGYSVEIDSEHTTTNVAKIASIATSGTILEVSAAGVLTGDVINITADAATTGKGINVSMDALTTGNMLYLDDASSSTSTRDCVKIIQNHDSAIAATALSVQSDSGVTGMLLDKNFPAAAVASATVRGLWIDFDHTVPSSGTAAMTDIGLDLDVNSAGLGTTTTTGIDLDVVGASSGTSTLYGINIAVGSADTNYAMVTSGGNVGIGTATPSTTLEVSGTLTESSSKHIKENIRDIDNALQSVLALKGIKFDFTEDIREDDDNNTDVLGLIAEDTYDVCPELVSTNKNGKPVAISYSKIPALLIEAMKEQQKEIEDLKNQVKTLLN